MVSGCSNSSIATIQVNSNSEHMETLEDLNLGVLFDFDFKLNEADKTWVNIWIEKYEDGKKVDEPLEQLSYGLSINKVDEGNLLFGMINPDKEVRSIFLSAPNVSTGPKIIENLKSPDSFEAWDYAIGDEKLELKYGKTYLLAVYRQSKGSEVRTGYDYQNEQELQDLINEHNIVCLLKIKLEEDKQY